MLETDKSVIEIHGVDAQTMNMLLEFMYKGKKKEVIKRIVSKIGAFEDTCHKIYDLII